MARLAVIWLTALVRKIATRSVPGLLTISALVLTVQTGLVLATGELWLFLLQFPLTNLCMCVLFAPTAGGPAGRCGTRASTLWFLSVLRGLGLKLRFAPA